LNKPSRWASNLEENVNNKEISKPYGKKRDIKDHMKKLNAMGKTAPIKPANITVP